MSEIEIKLRKILKNTIDSKFDLSKISNKKNLKKVGMNSISFIKFITEIENEFNFEFEDDDLIFDKFDNLKKFVTYIKNRLNS